MKTLCYLHHRSALVDERTPRHQPVDCSDHSDQTDQNVQRISSWLQTFWRAFYSVPPPPPPPNIIDHLQFSIKNVKYTLYNIQGVPVSHIIRSKCLDLDFRKIFKHWINKIRQNKDIISKQIIQGSFIWKDFGLFSSLEMIK